MTAEAEAEAVAVTSAEGTTAGVIPPAEDTTVMAGAHFFEGDVRVLGGNHRGVRGSQTVWCEAAGGVRDPVHLHFRDLIFPGGRPMPSGSGPTTGASRVRGPRADWAG
jgi:hypothetical protein